MLGLSRALTVGSVMQKNLYKMWKKKKKENKLRRRGSQRG